MVMQGGDCGACCHEQRLAQISLQTQHLTAVRSWMSPAPVRDGYGFQLQCDAQQMADRERCAQSSSKQALKWAKYAERQSLPSAEKLKKAVPEGRPVSGHAPCVIFLTAAVRKD